MDFVVGRSSSIYQSWKNLVGSRRSSKSTAFLLLLKDFCRNGPHRSSKSIVVQTSSEVPWIVESSCQNYEVVELETEGWVTTSQVVEVVQVVIELRIANR